MFLDTNLKVSLERRLSPPGAHQLGEELLLQNLSSMVAASALDVRPEHAILDLCAAPGHKARVRGSLFCWGVESKEKEKKAKSSVQKKEVNVCD